MGEGERDVHIRSVLRRLSPVASMQRLRIQLLFRIQSHVTIMA